MSRDVSNLEDQLLVMDAQDGNRAAMDTLVRRWQERLWRHAFRLTRNEQAAWDITQSAWYDIIRRLRKLHDPAAFRSWAYKITTCKSVDWIKRKRSTQSIPTETMDQLAAKQNPDSGIDELLGKLDVDKRAVLCLYYFEGLSVSEVAEALKIPAGTVKSRLYAARNALKELWEKTCE